ncbi:hypothetical protein QDX21_04995 [Auritidibacter ignavus]|uniref:Uncharacterized protein n=1 Tax=Auritidibacter ignavus TaxID=678932 RepID=A0AAJ6APZ1_9MICC|nr:hypothetical protein [Auritidibacter ignavus]WGH94151.1 hypothetical protein QDX21_04995 [Auritidibacter ignavus]
MSYESFHSRAGDYFGTCPVTGKRGYTSRKQARRARQGSGHVHGNPYKCRHCGLFHLGRYKAAKTRDEYRGMVDRGYVHVNTARKELGVSLNVLLLALDHLGVTPENSHIPASVLHQLKQLTYR